MPIRRKRPAVINNAFVKHFDNPFASGQTAAYSVVEAEFLHSHVSDLIQILSGPTTMTPSTANC